MNLKRIAQRILLAGTIATIVGVAALWLASLHGQSDAVACASLIS